MSLKSICTVLKLFFVNREKRQSKLVILRACKLINTIITDIQPTKLSLLLRVQLDTDTKTLRHKKGVFEERKNKESPSMSKSLISPHQSFFLKAEKA